MRVFVAILPPPEVVDQLDIFLAPRRDALADRGQWRWTRSEHLHITLAFIPDLDGWREEALIEAGEDWAARQSPLSVRLKGAGAFPDPGSARVLWAGIEEKAEGSADADPSVDEGSASVLPGWAKGLRAVANHAGARVDGTRFHPHLTLARSVGRPGPAGHLLQSLDTLVSPAWQVQDLVLMASHLGEGPRRTPRYEVRHRWVLGAPPVG